MGSTVTGIALAALAGCGRLGFESVDGGMDPGCAGSSVALCEDFEQGFIDPATWQTYEVLGTVTVDNQHVHRGNFAMHVHTDAVSSTSTGGARIELTTFPADRVYIRTFAYVPPAGDLVPFTQQVRGPTSGVQLIIQRPDRFRFYEWGSIPADQSASSMTAIPFDRWFCVEWMVDAAAASSRTWLDGVELADLHFTGIQTAPLVELSIGSALFDATDEPATDLWLDDIMIDGSPIGCI